MATSELPRKRLPSKPSEEHLRKEAKRFAREHHVRLATAQRRVAAEYGAKSWAELMRMAKSAAAAHRDIAAPLSALCDGAKRGDSGAVKLMLARGESAVGREGEASPLWHACESGAPASARLAIVRMLLDAGADPRRGAAADGTALHIAACRGPLAVVETLIRAGALTWYTDRAGRLPLDYARTGDAPDKDQIVTLLDRPVIHDPLFRRAVNAIHGGDLRALTRLLDEHPNLLRDRPREPDCYGQDYFRDPKLFWFVANNPSLMRTMPENIAEIARAMIARQVDKPDLDYTLELVMSSDIARKQGHQLPLMKLLIAAGATPTPRSIIVALAYRETESVAALVGRGVALTVPIAAALGRTDRLVPLLASASPEDRQIAFAMAVINAQAESARICLDAGADPNAPMPIHTHCFAMHSATVNDDAAMLRLLVEHGARPDSREKLWNSTPLGWAIHNQHPAAEAYLRTLEPS
ncbi:MAG: ankyrin repeat domain-containing protein [Candidatus Binataceae bacterium]